MNKNLLFSFLLSLSPFCVCDEIVENKTTEEITHSPETNTPEQQEINALIYEYTVQATEVTDNWNSIVEKTAALVSQINEYNNNNVDKNFDLTTEMLALLQEIHKLATEEGLFSGTTQGYLKTSSNTNVNEYDVENMQINSLVVRFSLTRINNEDFNSWQIAQATIQEFAQAMTNLEEKQNTFNVVAEYITKLQTLSNSPSINGNISIWCKSNPITQE